MKKRIWLITGISSGLGQAITQFTMDEGDFVVGTFRKQNEVDAFNEKHADKGKAFLLDVTDHRSIDEVVDNVKKEFGRIDVLVNNAGVGFAGAVEETSLKELREVMEVNFFGAFKVTQSVIPIMREQKSGHIIQISSHGGIKAFAGFGIYNASKFGLEGFSEALEQELKPLGIKVSIVEPGPFRTNFAGRGLTLAEKEIDDYAETSGAFRKKLKGVDGQQEGDPHKAAKAIFNLTKLENPSLRLPLGKTATITIGMKLDSVSNDLEKNKQIAENAVFQ